MPRGQVVAKAQREPVGPEMWNFAIAQERGKVLAFSGKQGAGKDSLCRQLYALAMTCTLRNPNNEPITTEAEVREDGKLYIYDVDGMHEFNEDSRHPVVRGMLAESVWPFIRKFSCAGPLKEFLHNVLQVPEKSLWGTQEEKNEPTHLRWENMPVPVFDLIDGTVQVGGLVDKQFEDSGHFLPLLLSRFFLRATSLSWLYLATSLILIPFERSNAEKYHKRSPASAVIFSLRSSVSTPLSFLHFFFVCSKNSPSSPANPIA